MHQNPMPIMPLYGMPPFHSPIYEQQM